MALGGKPSPARAKLPDIPSLVEIKRSLPAEVFESSLGVSMYYAVRSLVFVALLATGLVYARAAPWWETPVLRYAAIAFYVLMQGTVMWGMFTVGHDCGHSSFSRYPLVNWIVGIIMHSLILTPYESWRLTHRHHHKNTGHIDKDEVFYPMREHEQHWNVKTAPATLGIAWLVYLLFGFSPRPVYHMLPWDNFWSGNRLRVSLSVAAICGMVYALYQAVQVFGMHDVFLFYGAPLITFASWLVITTFLHHNEPGTMWYGDETWDYVRGNLSSIDRSYWPFDNIIHNIGTHQIHHLFPIIPHYKLVEATAVFREKYPELQQVSTDHFLPSFVRSFYMYLTTPAPTKDQQVFQYPAAGAKGKSE